jgi:hypothetical protein
MGAQVRSSPIHTPSSLTRSTALQRRSRRGSLGGKERRRLAAVCPSMGPGRPLSLGASWLLAPSPAPDTS